MCEGEKKKKKKKKKKFMSKDKINCQVSCKHAWMVKANVALTKLPLALAYWHEGTLLNNKYSQMCVRESYLNYFDSVNQPSSIMHVSRNVI